MIFPSIVKRHFVYRFALSTDPARTKSRQLTDRAISGKTQHDRTVSLSAAEKRLSVSYHLFANVPLSLSR